MLGAVAEIWDETEVFGTVIVGDSVVFVEVKVVGAMVVLEVNVALAEDVGIIVTANVMFAGDTFVVIEGIDVLVESTAWLRAGAVFVKAVVVLDKGAVVI